MSSVIVVADHARLNAEKRVVCRWEWCASRRCVGRTELEMELGGEELVGETWSDGPKCLVPVRGSRILTLHNNAQRDGVFLTSDL